MTDTKLKIEETANHTPGPWRIYNVLSNHEILTDRKTSHETVSIALFSTNPSAANARRIVAAVNACEGISTEALKSGAVVELLKACNYVQPHLEEYVRWHHKHQGGCSVEMEQALDLINAALTKATGRAA